MTTRDMDSLNRKIEILAAHFQGHGQTAIARKFRLSERGTRNSIRKSSKSPRIVTAANMLIAAKGKNARDLLEGAD